MRRCSFLFLFFAAAICLPACVCSFKPQAETEFQNAQKMIRTGQAECVLLQNGKIAVTERGHGVSPLLVVYETHKSDMKNAVVVDKVIGRAAAAIAICGKVKHVHGEVMSEDAAAFLNAHGITASHTLLVPRILNRKRDGLCPLEKSVEGISDPARALAALKTKIASFHK